MAYKLRFVQQFAESNRKEFIELERAFENLELEEPTLPKGKRYLTYAGKEPSNTLIWEADFNTLVDLHNAMLVMQQHAGHERLFQQQKIFLLKTYTEIYKPIEEER